MDRHTSIISGLFADKGVSKKAFPVEAGSLLD
jgi:hypothetical protein